MQQIAIKLDTWSDARFESLLQASGWPRPYALGVLTLLWANTRAASSGPDVAYGELRCALEATGCDVDQAVGWLSLSGYVTTSGSADNKVTVVDNRTHFALKRKLQDAGARGGYQKHKVRAPKKAKAAVVKTAETPSSTSVAWNTYAEAYRLRYRVEPVRNAAVMGQLARLVSLVGQDAPALAAFYVQHDGSFYIRCQHSIGALLKDYSGLYTQFQRNVTVTEHDVLAHSQNTQVETQLRRLGAR